MRSFYGAAGVLLLAACSYSTTKSTAPLRVQATKESVQRDFVGVSCLRCHDRATEANRFVDLSDVSKLTQAQHAPGNHRPALITPGCPNQSFFLSIVREKKMPPPPGDSVSAETIAAVERWIVSLQPDAGPTCAGSDEPGAQDTPGPDEP